MRILLTNDDGYRAQAIQILFQHLSKEHEVTMIAPEQEKSAASHSLSLNQPLRLFPIKLDTGVPAYCVNGTPADCVKLGLSEVFTNPPDMVISGINVGFNMGVDIHYSGTVAGAREGVLNGVSAMAVSIGYGKLMDFSGLADFSKDLVSRFPSMNLSPGVFLNVNAPSDMKISQTKGFAITSQSQENFIRRLVHKKDPWDKDYFWYGQNESIPGGSGTDAAAIKEGYISITPISCNLTSKESLKDLSKYLQVKI